MIWMLSLRAVSSIFDLIRENRASAASYLENVRYFNATVAETLSSFFNSRLLFFVMRLDRAVFSERNWNCFILKTFSVVFLRIAFSMAHFIGLWVCLIELTMDTIVDFFMCKNAFCSVFQPSLEPFIVHIVYESISYI